MNVGQITRETGNLDASLGIIDLGVRLWAGRLALLAAVVCGLVLAAAYLHLAKRTYTAELKITVAPSARSGSSGGLSELSGIASAAGLVVGSSNQTATPFDLYLDALTGRQVADTLAADPRIMQSVFAIDWDATSMRWRHVETGRESAVKLAKSVLGIPVAAWRRPDATALQSYLGRSITIRRSPSNPIVRVTYDDADPEFARYLLVRLHATSDRKVRIVELARATSYARYLAAKLPTVSLLEQRKALADALGDQEQSIMMASSDVPFAANPVGPVTSSPLPSSPNWILVLGAFCVAALLLGVLVVLLRSPGHYIRAGRRRDGASPQEV